MNGFLKSSCKTSCRSQRIPSLLIKIKFKSTFTFSDRTDQIDATIKNLEEQGLPAQGRDHLMFKKKREINLKNHEIMNILI